MANKITEAADKMRLMTDEELIVYLENRAAKAREDGFNQGFYLGKKEIKYWTGIDGDKLIAAIKEKEVKKTKKRKKKTNTGR